MKENSKRYFLKRHIQRQISQLMAKKLQAISVPKYVYKSNFIINTLENIHLNIRKIYPKNLTVCTFKLRIVRHPSSSG